MMNKNKNKKNKVNRRQAFRIYEQVDLVYHKIEFNQLELNNTNFNNILKSTVESFNAETRLSSDHNPAESFLPASCSQKNETLNINISSTGISFTSKEALEPGDYLMIRVLLLSSLIVVTTCCKVVYIKPSNPFEENQYPHTIGVRFVRLKAEDKALLDKHVSKKRTQHMIVYGLMAFFALVFIQVPDLIIELVIDLFSFIMDEVVELLHLLYEVVEYGLDHIIEHIFHTDMQSTQTIVFYLQNIIMIVLLIPVIRAMVLFCKKTMRQSQLSFYRKKASLFYCWREQTVLYKLGIICLAVMLFSFFVLGLV